MPDRLSRAYIGAIALLGLLCAAAIFSVLPFATQDGPVHITFGNFLVLDRDAHPLLFQHYRTNETFEPNSVVYVLFSVLLRVFSPAITEALVQVLCTLGVVASAWFALRQVSLGTDTTWLTLLVFPLALSRLFFFGTYNFCLSIAGFLLVIGSFVRLQNHSTLGRGLAVIAALYVAFFAHAAGFLAAGVAISVLALTQAGVSLRAGIQWGAIVRSQRVNLIVLVSPLPLVLAALSGNGDAPVAYGVGLQDRLLDLALLETLRVHAGPGKDLATLFLNPVLFGGVAALAISLWLERRDLATSTRGDAVGALAVFVSMLALALVFPDTLGGGWIHFQRMVLFPYLAAVLCLAYRPVPTFARAAIASIATVVTVALLFDAVTAQREIARQMQPLAEVDRIVAEHCSVLPLVLSAKPLDDHGRPMNVGYNPYVHVATRLELARDRVSLFNYQARTSLYPVRFQQKHDTQELIFHWRPMQRSVGFRTIDVKGFEDASGMPIDYILQWGPLDAADPQLRERVLEVEQGADRVYVSADGRVSLFRRPHVRSRCAG